MADSKDIEAAAFRKKKHADYMREYNRRNGATPVKDTRFVCDDCSLSFPRKDKKQKRCADCRITFMREHSRARRLRVGHVPIGTKLKCKNCSIEIEKSFKRQFYCDQCSKLSDAGMLPHQIEKTRQRYNRFQIARRRKNPKWSIAARMSAGIRNSLIDGKGGRSWESLVRYTVADLMTHLERQLLPGMTWVNRGEWHIEHIVPVAAFSFKSANDEQFTACWALANLRPLWAVDNLSKGPRRTHLL